MEVVKKPMADVNRGLQRVPHWPWDEMDLPPLATGKGGKPKGLAPKHVRATVFLDTETTGLFDGWRDGRQYVCRPIDVCAIKISAKGHRTEYDTKIAVTQWELDRADPHALEIVGFDAKEWEGAPRRELVMVELYNFIIGCQLVGHNIEADLLRFLLPSWRWIHIVPSVGFVHPIVCTEMLARAMLPGLRKYTLEALCEHFEIPPEGHHRARGGAERCMRVYYKLCGREAPSL